jgi:hypothetical protein
VCKTRRNDEKVVDGKKETKKSRERGAGVRERRFQTTENEEERKSK